MKRKGPVDARSDAVLLEAVPKVSVIVPVYGVERYLEECLASVLGQSLQDIELICVNDQSPDRSQEILDRVAADDPRLRSIVQPENRGQGFARNLAIEKARGKYVFFLDADDLLADANVLEDAVLVAEATHSDLVRVQKLVFIDGTDPENAHYDPAERHFLDPRQITPPFSDISILRSWHFWQYLFSRDLLIRYHVRFSTPQWEERYFICKAMKHAERLTVLPRAGVRYRRRAHSTTARQRTKRDLEIALRAIADIGSEFSGHDLGPAIGLQIARFFVGSGPWATSIRREMADNPGSVVDRLRVAFSKFDCRFDGLVAKASEILETPQDAIAATLFLCALASNRDDLVTMSVNLAKIGQADLHDAYRTLRETEIDLATALNLYARNGSVKTEEIASGPRSNPRVILTVFSSIDQSVQLQSALDRNRVWLIQNGIWYPEVGLFWQPERGFRQSGHAGFIHAAKNNDPGLRDYIDAGVELAEGEIHTIVLSSEAFFLNATSENVVRYLSEYPVEVFVFLNPQDEWAESQYSETVLGGAGKPISDNFSSWLASQESKGRLDHRNVIERFRAALPHNRVVVNPLSRRGVDQVRIVEAFAKAVDLPEIRNILYVSDPCQKSAGLTIEQAELMAKFNARGFDKRADNLGFVNGVSGKLRELESGIEASRPNVVSTGEVSNELEALLKKCAKSNAKVAREWFGREAGGLFDQTDARPTRIARDVTEEEVSICENAYKRWCRSMAARAEADAENHRSSIINYGLFGWRLWALSPLVRLGVNHSGSADDQAQFNHSPAQFLHSLESPEYRKLAKRLYPQWNVFGPWGAFGVWVPALEQMIKITKGDQEASNFRQDPIVYVRSRPSILFRILARLALPAGELAPENDRPEDDWFG